MLTFVRQVFLSAINEIFVYLVMLFSWYSPVVRLGDASLITNIMVSLFVASLLLCLLLYFSQILFMNMHENTLLKMKIVKTSATMLR